MAERAKGARVRHEREDLGYVDGGQSTPHHHRALGHFDMCPVVIRLVAVVEPLHQCVLIEEPATQVLVDAGDRQRAVAPRAVREDDRGEPHATELLEADVLADLCAWHEAHVVQAQVRVDARVLLLSQLEVPAR